jgi:hypothetical protein
MFLACAVKLNYSLQASAAAGQHARRAGAPKSFPYGDV